MTWLVKVALDRPYTFIVMALMILIFGPLAAIRTPTDIFPNIGIPVIGVAFNYSGLSPDEMGARIVASYERFLSNTVNDVEHFESQSMPGLGIVKIYFQPNVDIRLATAQVTSVSQTAIRQMPVGHPAALDHQLQRLHRAGAADGLLLHLLVRTAGAGLFAELRPPAPDHGAGRGRALFLWRQIPLGADRS